MFSVPSGFFCYQRVTFLLDMVLDVASGDLLLHLIWFVCACSCVFLCVPVCMSATFIKPETKRESILK